MLAGFAIAWLYYIQRRGCRPRPPAHSGRSTCSSRISGISTNSTTRFSCGPPSRIGRFLWKDGDGAIIDGTIDGTAARRHASDAVASSSCRPGYVYHYAFAMLVGVAALLTWLTSGAGLPAGPRHEQPPFGRHVPAARRRAADCASEPRSASGTRAGSRSGRRSSRSQLSLLIWANFDKTRPASSSSKSTPGSGRSNTKWASTASRCCSSS